MLIAVGYAMIWKAMGVLNFSGPSLRCWRVLRADGFATDGEPDDGQLFVIAGLMVPVAGLAIALAVL